MNFHLKNGLKFQIPSNFGDIGVVITNNSFLNSGIKFAESHDVELWDRDKLISF